MLADRVEAEEHLLVVDDVELEQRGEVVDPDLYGGLLDQAEVGQLVDRVADGLGVAPGDGGARAAEVRVVGQVLGAAGQRPGRGGVGQQHADADGLGRQAAGADLVERLLDDAVQGLAGEAGEVDRDVWLLEGALDVRAQADRSLGALADEHAAALPADDEALVAQDAERLLDGLAGDAVALGQLVADGSRSPGASCGQDRGAQHVRDLHVGRPRVVRIEAHGDSLTGSRLGRLDLY